MFRNRIIVFSIIFLFFSCVQKVDKIKIIESEIAKCNFNGKSYPIESFTAKTLLSTLGIKKALVYMDDSTIAVFLDLFEGTTYSDLKKDIPDVLNVMAALYKIDYDKYSVDMSLLDDYVFEQDSILVFTTGKNSAKIKKIVLEKI